VVKKAKLTMASLLCGCISTASSDHKCMRITVELPDASLSITKERPEDFARSMRIAAAVKWYELGRISQSKAAELIGCNRVELFNHLHDHGVPFLQTSVADLDVELADERI
jgi:predicted HTH domain antitoxin